MSSTGNESGETSMRSGPRSTWSPIQVLVLALLGLPAVLGVLYLAVRVTLGYGVTTGYSPLFVLAVVAVLVVGMISLLAIVGSSVQWRRFRNRIRTRIRTRLTVSHVLVVTLSLLVFSALMSVLYIWILSTSGYDFSDQLFSLFAMTVIVLLIIGFITACSIIVAMIASKYVSRRLTLQIDELEQATESIAAGHLDRRVAVLTEDELGSLAVRFNALAARLEELDQQRRSFVASISHDLRTPLAIIRGHVDAQLRPHEEETAEAPEAFRAIEHEAITLGKLIDDLFTLSRLEEAALAMQREPVDIGALVEDAVRGIRPYALKASRVSVNAAIPEALPPALGDPTRINQILNNLLHNAVRHTPEGGIVIVEASADPDSRGVRVTVRDTGVGISSEDLPRIFDRFYQGDSVRSGGAGLGLSIVKQLVEAQDGSVTADSEPGEGTTIMVTLPAVSDTPVSHPPRVDIAG